jgi:hypothetical protein
MRNKSEYQIAKTKMLFKSLENSNFEIVSACPGGRLEQANAALVMLRGGIKLSPCMPGLGQGFRISCFEFYTLTAQNE